MTHRFSDLSLNVARLSFETAAVAPNTANAAAQRSESPSLPLEMVPLPGLMRPTVVHVPDGYEPNYAYPLIVWFHDAGEDERVLHRIMPVVSERNALGLALRGERMRRNGGYEWAAIDPQRRAQILFERVRDLRRDYHVHTERVILAGRGTGAAVAASLFFARPEWFGGLAQLDLPSESLPADLVTSEALAGKPVLLDLPVEQLGRGRDGASRFAAAGLDVTFRHARSHALCGSTLRHLNRWMMATVCGVALPS